jgi:hypothetical protein
MALKHHSANEGLRIAIPIEIIVDVMLRRTDQLQTRGAHDELIGMVVEDQNLWRSRELMLVATTIIPQCKKLRDIMGLYEAPAS